MGESILPIAVASIIADDILEMSDQEFLKDTKMKNTKTIEIKSLGETEIKSTLGDVFTVDNELILFAAEEIKKKLKEQP